MLPTNGYATNGPKADFELFHFERRDPKPHDVVIEILFCGICHSDIHQARNEWGGATYPMVPGHEIVGRVTRVGDKVTKYKKDDLVGVGCFVDSCRVCENCKEGEEQLCTKLTSVTYNGKEQDGKTPTYGGYSSQIVVDENYILKINSQLPLESIAPLLCAGITTYSPLKRHKAGPGKNVGVVGLGGLGHMAVKIAAAMGAEVTVFSTSASKQKDAERLGAKHFVVTNDPKALTEYANKYDLIIDAVSAPHDINTYLQLLRKDGVVVIVGAPPKPFETSAFAFIKGRKNLTGSLIGGIPETQEMLDFCAKHNIAADIELIPIQKLAEAYQRTLDSDVRYRFVIDMKSLEKS